VRVVLTSSEELPATLGGTDLDMATLDGAEIAPLPDNHFHA
jgi:hypothetical protein